MLGMLHKKMMVLEDLPRICGGTGIPVKCVGDMYIWKPVRLEMGFGKTPAGSAILEDTSIEWRHGHLLEKGDLDLEGSWPGLRSWNSPRKPCDANLTWHRNVF